MRTKSKCVNLIAFEVRVAEDGAAQVPEIEVGPRELGTFEIHVDEPCVGEITFGALLGLAQTLEVLALLPKRGSGEQGAADKDGDAQPDSNPSHKFLPSPSGFSVSGAECFHRATRFGSNPGEILLLYGDDPSLPTMGAGSVDPLPPGATFANWG